MYYYGFLFLEFYIFIRSWIMELRRRVKDVL